MAGLTDSGVFEAIDTAMTKSFESHIKPMQEKQATMSEAMYGEKNKPQTGVISRVFRLENIAKVLVAFIVIFITACVYSAVDRWFEKPATTEMKQPSQP